VLSFYALTPQRVKKREREVLVEKNLHDA